MVKEEIGFCPICSGVGEEAINEILSFAKNVDFVEGQHIYSQDEPHKGIYIVIKGEVRVTAQNKNGKEFLVKKQSSGETFGETGAVGRVYLESAEAIKATHCIFLPSDEILELASRNAALSASLFSSLGQWVADFYERFQTLSFTNVRERVEFFFTREAQKIDNPLLSLQLKRHEIASNLGIRPETLSRVLADLQKEGLIKIENNVVDLSNFNHLNR